MYPSGILRCRRTSADFESLLPGPKSSHSAHPPTVLNAPACAKLSDGPHSHTAFSRTEELLVRTPRARPLVRILSPTINTQELQFSTTRHTTRGLQLHRRAGTGAIRQPQGFGFFGETRNEAKAQLPAGADIRGNDLRRSATQSVYSGKFYSADSREHDRAGVCNTADGLPSRADAAWGTKSFDQRRAGVLPLGDGHRSASEREHSPPCTGLQTSAKPAPASSVCSRQRATLWGRCSKPLTEFGHSRAKQNKSFRGRSGRDKGFLTA